MPFNPKRYSRLAAAEQRARQALDAAPPGALRISRKQHARAVTALATYVDRWPAPAAE